MSPWWSCCHDSKLSRPARKQGSLEPAPDEAGSRFALSDTANGLLAPGKCACSISGHAENGRASAGAWQRQIRGGVPTGAPQA